jgi:hypothetical protein
LQRQFAGKTLWDWISLLLIPLLIGIGTIVVTYRQTDAQEALSMQLHQSDQAQHQQDAKLAQEVLSECRERLILETVYRYAESTTSLIWSIS